jgi:hypothetical protein
LSRSAWPANKLSNLVIMEVFPIEPAARAGWQNRY